MTAAQDAADMANATARVIPLLPPERSKVESVLERMLGRLASLEAKMEQRILDSQESDRKLDQIIERQQAQDAEARGAAHRAALGRDPGRRGADRAGGGGG